MQHIRTRWMGPLRNEQRSLKSRNVTSQFLRLVRWKSMFKCCEVIKCQRGRQNEWPKTEGSFQWSSPRNFRRAVLTAKSRQVPPIDHMLFVLANRNVYLVTPCKIYIYYIDTEYEWGILSGILWLCCKTNCHICLNSCFSTAILQSSSIHLYSETLLLPKPPFYTIQQLMSLFFNFILWHIATVALQLAVHSMKLRHCSRDITGGTVRLQFSQIMSD